MTEHPARLQYLYHQFINDVASAEELDEFWQAMDALKDDDPVKEVIFQQYGEKMPAAFQKHVPDWNNALKKIMDIPQETSDL